MYAWRDAESAMKLRTHTHTQKSNKQASAKWAAHFRHGRRLQYASQSTSRDGKFLVFSLETKNAWQQSGKRINISSRILNMLNIMLFVLQCQLRQVNGHKATANEHTQKKRIEITQNRNKNNEHCWMRQKNHRTDNYMSSIFFTRIFCYCFCSLLLLFLQIGLFPKKERKKKYARAKKAKCLLTSSFNVENG